MTELKHDNEEVRVKPEEIRPILKGGNWGDVPDLDAWRPKRRSGMKTAYIADITWRTRPAPPPQKHKKNLVGKEQLKDALSTTAHHSSIYILDIFLRALRFMIIPLSMLFALWMLAFVITRISDTLRTAFAPICYLPFVSRSVLCAPLDSNILRHPKWADFPQLMEVQGSTFEQLLGGSAGGSGLALEIRKAGFATADLATIVRHSNLRSNDVLADLLMAFGRDAKKTARGLTKLSSKMDGAVDNIMAVNGYAMRTIQDAEKNTPSPHSFAALNPFHTGATTQEVIVGAFTSAMDTFSVTIQRLILEAEISLLNLDTLEEDLSAIREAVMREDLSVAAEKSELWTIPGWNGGKLRDYEKRLNLLKDLGNYRKQAQAHVLAALQTLNSMSEDMEDLRERVAAPELVDGRIPLHVHIESIQNSLQRLQEGRVRAKEREEEAMRKVLGMVAE